MKKRGKLWSDIESIKGKQEEKKKRSALWSFCLTNRCSRPPKAAAELNR